MKTNISMYCEKVIYPIEQKKNKLRNSILKKGSAASEEEKELLEKYENLLLEKYKVLEKLLEETLEDQEL